MKLNVSDYSQKIRTYINLRISVQTRRKEEKYVEVMNLNREKPANN